MHDNTENWKGAKMKLKKTTFYSIALLLAGCVPSSLHPLYNDQSSSLPTSSGVIFPANSKPINHVMDSSLQTAHSDQISVAPFGMTNIWKATRVYAHRTALWAAKSTWGPKRFFSVISNGKCTCTLSGRAAKRILRNFWPNRRYDVDLGRQIA